MSVLLHIDTAVEGASLCISVHEEIISFSQNENTKDSARWLHVALDKLFKEAAMSPDELDAISISAGPGSYTGLRVGMAAAKGLCYALNIPLICVSTLKMMAFAAVENKSGWLCPMIDARRMEVFTALYDENLNEIISPQNLILTTESFAEQIRHHKIIFFGNGSEKFTSLQHSTNAEFLHIEANAKHLVPLAYRIFIKKEFGDLAYAEPYYGKEFYSPSPATHKK
jgi:tRNA threonylcarbamoyladenosine biosynthesis protein TsaB